MGGPYLHGTNMELLSINLATVKQVEYNQRLVSTGIYKTAVEGSIKVTALGLEGDVQIDRENHGGPDKAIYVYTLENYRFWEQELQKQGYSYGQFGENFTVTGMPDERIHIGDLFRIGSVLTQVTQPRVPCFKLGIKMGDPTFVKRFLSSGRVGFYLRVLEEGEVQAGDRITRVQEDPERLNIRDAMLALAKGPHQKVVIKRALGIEALSAAWRNNLSMRLNTD
jgi:MOSC domain-containing protein YiiM